MDGFEGNFLDYLKSQVDGGASNVTLDNDWRDELSEGQDIVHFTIFCDRIAASSNTIESALALCEKILNWIGEECCDYIWHSGHFNLSVCIPSNTDDEIYLKGSLEYGENIEDEWYTFYLLRKLTMDPIGDQLSIAVTDADGQFLLIEAADVLPDWLDPENSANRIWIRSGRIHVIPNTIQPRSISRIASKNLKKKSQPLFYLENDFSPNEIDVADALSALRKNATTTCGTTSRRIEKAIESRIEGYPEKVLASQHKVVVLLPLSVASLFRHRPSLVAPAMQAFDSQLISREDKRRYFSAMARFGPEISSVEKVTSQLVTMTRAQYAQLTFKPFHLPKKFQTLSASLDAAYALATTNAVGNTKESEKTHDVLFHFKSRDELKKSWELGARLTCGLEAAYQYTKRISKLKCPQSAGNHVEEERLQELFRSCVDRSKRQEPDKLMKTIREPFQEGLIALDSQEIPSELPSSFQIPVTIDSNNGNRRRRVTYSVDEYMEVVLSSKTVVAADAPLALRGQHLLSDDDSWLYLSPEDLEEEMRSRVKDISCPQGFSATKDQLVDEEGVIEGNKDVDGVESLNKVLSKFNMFLDEKSDFRGVSNNVANRPRESVEDIFGEDGNEAGSSVGSEQEEEEVEEVDEYERDSDCSGDSEEIFGVVSSAKISNVKKENKKNDSGKNFLSFATASFSSSSSSLRDSQAGFGRGIISKVANKESPRLSGSKAEEIERDSSDSDDVNSDDDDFMEQYQNSMEQELFGNQKSTLGSSFETYEDSDDEGDSATGVKQVDVDKNILKYMLEAHAAQLGGSGPASNLLSQLGIVLPKPPPPTRVGNRKSSNKDQ